MLGEQELLLEGPEGGDLEVQAEESSFHGEASGVWLFLCLCVGRSLFRELVAFNPLRVGPREGEGVVPEVR